MSRSGVAVFLVVVAVGLASLVCRDEQCVAKFQAPEYSPWRAMGVASSKVQLSKVARIVGKHGLRLEKGQPPPLDSEALVIISCKDHGDMWMALPSPAEDDSAFGCWMEKLTESMYKLFGKLKEKPKQYPDSPPRKYMKNYCGKELPLTSPASDAGRRMGPNTITMHKKLRQILKSMPHSKG